MKKLFLLLVLLPVCCWASEDSSTPKKSNRWVAVKQLELDTRISTMARDYYWAKKDYAIQYNYLLQARERNDFPTIKRQKPKVEMLKKRAHDIKKKLNALIREYEDLKLKVKVNNDGKLPYWWVRESWRESIKKRENEYRIWFGRQGFK